MTRSSAISLVRAAVFLGLTIVALPAVAADKPAVELKALFLGDSGHHQPADRAAQLIPVMSGRGIQIDYTDRLVDLNPENLAKYDALILYANTTQIEPREEQALLDYVASGHGFVPLHCASYCFLNSPKFIELVGGQFQKHGTGEFDTRTVDSEHPITKGLAPFRTWDETYVHTKHNEKDRHILQTRDDASGKEPWTWVRTHGKGRVFYTAYGHDARTWSQPGFQALVERGIRWASAKGEVFDSTPKKKDGLKPFTYAESKDKLPNYTPGAKPGDHSQPITKMQNPLSPAESREHLIGPHGLEFQLFAAEPDIAKPIAMTWDHLGRLWIAETVDYPNEKQPEGKGNDRIKLCEDTDGDGRADKFTVFADGLSIPTSLTPVAGGLVVHQAPETLFLKDTDGDGKADIKKVLFTGWSVGDTHAGPSNLQYGFDNWLYGMVGYSGFKGTIGGEAHEFRTGFYRFKPDGSKFEFLRNTNNNSWGVSFSEEGLLFGSTANGNPSVYLPIPNRYYEAVRGWSSSVLGSIATDTRFYPITEKVRQVDWHGRFTAAAGHALYTARTYPKQYWNRTAFVTEPTGHLVATFVLDRKGSDFTSTNSWNLAASDDEWTSPIMAEVGPDGSVWMIDWYNYIVQHNPTPQGFKTGKGNAYETPLRDKTHGRIYRIVASVGKPSVQPKLDPADGPSLVAALSNDNLFWRKTAQRLLVERGQADVIPALVKLIETAPTDEIGLCPGAIHALWTLQGLGAMDGKNPQTGAVAVASLKHATPGVRRAALQVLPRNEEGTAAILAAGVLADPDAHVRQAALLALAESPTSPPAAAAILAALSEPANLTDRWIPDAATAAAASHSLPFLTGVASRDAGKPLTDKAAAIVRQVAEHCARSGPVDAAPVLLASLGGESSSSEAIVAGLVKGWPRDKQVPLDDAAEAKLAELLPKLTPAARGQLVSLATRWGSKGLEKYATQVAEGFLKLVKNDKEKDPARVAAAAQLIEFRKSDDAAALELLGQITPKASPELVAGLIEAVGKSESPAVGQALVESLGTVTPAARSGIFRALVSRAEWTEALFAGVDQGKLQLADLSLDQKQALAGHPSKSIAARAKKLLASAGGLPNPDRQKVIDEISAVVLKKGDSAKGKLVFTQQCAKCHMHGGEGKKIGPDLTGMAAHPKHELLIHLLDPSRSVEGNFKQYSLVTDDGRVMNGLLAAETKTAVELIDAEGKSHQVLRENIEELTATKKSIMPEGFEKQVPAEAITDLLEFLTQRGKYLPLDLSKVASAVSTKGMFYSHDADAERLIFADWTPKSVEGVPFQLVDPRGDRVPNVVLLYGPTGKIPPEMPKSVALPVNGPARAIHLLSGVAGWAFNGTRIDPTVSMIVRIKYADGKTEDHPLENGVHFADYIRPVDVPQSKLAFKLRGQQIRFLSVFPKRQEAIEKIELVKGPDGTAPIVMAVTVETQ